jgi:glycosyltransferase involved in cell wall biosynthesis
MDTRPLVTFCVLSFNQEKYVREAVEGALAQDYSPLEIILSDDSSSDRTFEIMKEMAENYSGAHRIILNQNSQNQGVGGHVNRIMEIANGQWIVVAAGDDISRPRRVSETIESAVSNPHSYSIFGDLDYLREDPSNQAINIPDVNTHSLFEMIRWGGAKVSGPSHAWHRNVFDVFGPLLPGVVSEDRAIPFRSALLGNIVWTRKTWTQYRIHHTSISTSGRNSANLEAYNRARLAPLYRTAVTFESFAKDLETALEENIIDVQQYEALSAAIRFQRLQVSRYIQAWSGSYIRRLICSLQIFANPSPFTGDSNYQRFGVVLNAICPFIDPLYHRLVRMRRI